MSFISYAQNFEDVILWRALMHVECGFYIDVGANDPEADSVTKAFYDRGWRGINIEPVSQWYERLLAKRPRDINLQIAAGAETGEAILYELMDTGLSTLDKATAERHEAEQGYQKKKQSVSVRTLTDICIEYHVTPIHFLKIDVEGAEKQVLLGTDFEKIRPWIVVVESTLPNSQIEDYEDWEPILLKNGYSYVYFDGLNRFYLAHERQPLIDCFRSPPNVFDDFIRQPQFVADLRAHEAERIAASQGQRAEVAGEQVKLQEARAEAAEDQAKLQEQRAEAAEDQAKLQEQRAEAAEEQARVQEQRAEAAEEQARVQEQRAEAAEEQARVQEQRAQAVEEQAKLAEDFNQQLQKSCEEANIKINELHQSNHHWWSVADSLSNELQNVYMSKSWRITWPLRALKRVTIESFQLTVRLTKATIRPLVILAIRSVPNHSGLHYQLKKRLQKYPRVYIYLRQFAHHRGLTGEDRVFMAQQPPVRFNVEIVNSSTEMEQSKTQPGGEPGRYKAVISSLATSGDDKPPRALAEYFDADAIKSVKALIAQGRPKA